MIPDSFTPYPILGPGWFFPSLALFAVAAFVILRHMLARFRLMRASVIQTVLAAALFIVAGVGVQTVGYWMSAKNPTMWRTVGTITTVDEAHPDMAFTLDTSPGTVLVYAPDLGKAAVWPETGTDVELKCFVHSDPRVDFGCRTV